MEDKRIRKTKKTLKTTLIKMLKEETFDQVSITELCKNADISRITFYSHYSDKFAPGGTTFLPICRRSAMRITRAGSRSIIPSGSVVQGVMSMCWTPSWIFIMPGLIFSGILTRRRIRTLPLPFIISCWTLWSSTPAISNSGT